MPYFRIKRITHNLRYGPIALIGLYQRLVSPFFPPTCRFYPPCSTYARLAFKKYGVFKGGLLSLIRILKCHPFHPGGYDPIT